MVCLIGKWYWCLWVEFQRPAICQMYVYLDIAGVSKDAPSQKHQKCMYLIMFDWKMVLVLVGGVQMSSNMAKHSFFTGTVILCVVCVT